MAILAECPICHNKQKTSNKFCKCGENLDKAKRSKRVRYWISYYLPGKKQRREPVGYSLKEARTAEGKRKVQKRENRFFEMLPESKDTFKQLSKWYLELSSVKKLASYDRINGCIKNFNAVYGDYKVSDLKPIDLENYQDKREQDGKAPGTIDMELSIVKTMVTKAFDNDKVSGQALKAFRKTKRLLKKGANARNRILDLSEYLSLKENAAQHLSAFLTVGFHTGMRLGELRKLQWSMIDRENGFIRLPIELTKENKSKSIPINYHVENVLNDLPRALHHNFVFTYQGQPIKSPDGLKKSFKAGCKGAGIPYGRNTPDGVTFHDLRGTFKTNMARAGVSKPYRDRILGHKSQDMDRHYIRLTDEDFKAAMNQFTSWYDSEVELQSIDQSNDHETKTG